LKPLHAFPAANNRRSLPSWKPSSLTIAVPDSLLIS
jgi:hypothetical protein